MELLFIEDDVLFGRAVLRTLRATVEAQRRLSVDTEWAMDFSHAARRVHGDDPVDLVVCAADLGLDRAIELLRACMLVRPCARRVAYVSSASPEDEARLRAVVHALLRKPFRRADLAAAVAGRCAHVCPEGG